MVVWSMRSLHNHPWAAHLAEAAEVPMPWVADAWRAAAAGEAGKGLATQGLFVLEGEGLR